MKRIYVVGRNTIEKARWLGYVAKLYSMIQPITLWVNNIEHYWGYETSAEEWMEGVIVKVYHDEQQLESALNSYEDQSHHLIDYVGEGLKLNAYQVVLFTSAEVSSLRTLEKSLVTLLGKQIPSSEKTTLHLQLFQIYGDSKISEKYYEQKIQSLLEGTAYTLSSEIYFFDELDQTKIVENSFENRFYYGKFSKALRQVINNQLKHLSITDKRQIKEIIKLAERSKK